MLYTPAFSSTALTISFRSSLIAMNRQFTASNSSSEETTILSVQLNSTSPTLKLFITSITYRVTQRTLLPYSPLYQATWLMNRGGVQR